MSSDHPLPVTVDTVTADLSDGELRSLAADCGLSGRPIPELRRLIAISRLSERIFALGQLSHLQSARRAAEQLGIESSVSPQ